MRIITARQTRPFESVADLARRAALSTTELQVLAAAGALHSLAGHRRQACWAAAGSEAAPGLLREAPIPDPMPSLPSPGETQEVIADYARLGFSLGRHPLSFLRGLLREERFLSAAEIAACPDRKLARAAGIVTCRQRPATASGVLFVTLEDETGFVNLVVWSDIVERNRRPILGSRLLAVGGQVQKEGLVVHVLARQFEDLSGLLGELRTTSHDFH